MSIIHYGNGGKVITDQHIKNHNIYIHFIFKKNKNIKMTSGDIEHV